MKAADRDVHRSEERLQVGYVVLSLGCEEPGKDPEAAREARIVSRHEDQSEVFVFAGARQPAGNGSKSSAPCQLENRCQLHPNRSHVRRA